MGLIVSVLKKVVPSNARIALRKILALDSTGFNANTVDALNGMDLKEKFSDVYKKNIFGGKVSRSGNGSDDVQTAVIRKILPELVREFGVERFLDAPCGDWYWMQKVDLRGASYVGIDIVEQLIDANKHKFGSSTVDFKCVNLVDGDIPKADMVFSRDCLVHLSYEHALKIIANFKRSGAKYLLTTTFSDRIKNEDLGSGFWRPLNLTKAPFNFPEPLRLLNEGCTEEDNLFADKCLGLWLLDDIRLNQ